MRKQAVKQAFENNSMEVCAGSVEAEHCPMDRQGRPARDRDTGLVTLSAD